MKKLIVIVLLTPLFACSSNSTKSTAPYNLKYEFHSDKNYQLVYRLILNTADSCTSNVGTSKSITEGQLFSELKAADISILQQSFLGKYPHIRIKIDADSNKTKINVSNDFEKWDKLAKAIEGWVNDKSVLCK